jgi:hypothetical protein
VWSSEDKAGRMVMTSLDGWLGHTRLACDSGGGGGSWGFVDPGRSTKVGTQRRPAKLYRQRQIESKLVGPPG